MDIRKFFSPINKKSVTPAKNGEKKRKKNIESDDEEDPLPSRCRKNKVLESDSDDDLFVITPSKKVSKTNTNKYDNKSAQQPLSKSQTPKQSKKKSSPKLKPVSVNDYFNSTSSKLKLPTKRKVENVASEDEAFEKTLEQLDAAKESSKKSKKDIEPLFKSKEDSLEDRKLTNGTHGLSSKLAMKMKANAGKDSEKSGREDEKSKPPKQQIKNKLTPVKEIKSTSVNETKYTATKESQFTKEKDSKTTPAKDTKVTPQKESILTSANESKSTLGEESQSTPLNKSKSTQLKESKPTPLKESKSTQRKESKSTSAKDSKSPLKKSTSLPIQVSHKAAPTHQHQEEKSTPDWDEQKKQRVAAYRKFLNRSGPKNPGGKPLPEGAPNCLSKLTFVLTGVLDTIDREETAQLIHKYGGRVTTSVSRNTSYLVVGDEPGQSKTKKAEQLGTPMLDEDELFQLIQTQSLKESTPVAKIEVKSETNKCDAKAKLSSFYAEGSKTKTSSPLDSMASCKKLSSSPLHASKASKASKLSPDHKESSQKSSPLLVQGSSGSEAGSLQATESLSSQELTSPGVIESSLWVEKYRPTSLKNIIGQHGEQSNAKKLLRWLRDWISNHFGGKKKGPAPGPWGKDNTGSYFKAALLSGPPGVGKTTTAHIVSRELEFDVVELNASDTRSKRTLAEEVTELLSNTSLAAFATGNSGKHNAPMRKRVLIMDEVDGMAGNEDRGGVQELIALIKGSHTPIICLCNDRNHQKIRSLANYCFDLRFQKPRVEQIRSAMMTVCFRENIKIKPEALDQMITGSNQDIRQVLHHLSLWSATDKSMDSEDVKKDAKSAKKDYKLGPWDVCSKVFSASAHRQMSIHDKISLFFHDYSIGPLFVQENYLKASPDCARGDRDRLLKQIAMTSQVLADSDIVEKSIRRESAWSLLPTQAILSSVCPGEYMAGHLSAQIEFPSWLGKNSSRNKFDRIAQEIQTHARLRISGTKEDIILDYSPMLRNKIVTPLSQHGLDGVREAVDLMLAYNFLREDWDSLVELGSWPGQKDPRAGIDAKVKAAFTRTLNKESLPTPFAIAPAPRKSSSNPHPESYGELEDERISSDEEADDKDDISKDAMIKRGKLSQKTESGKKDGSSSAKGKGKGARGVKK